MAEVTVSSLLLKLGDVVLQKAITLYGVGDRVETMKTQLIEIQCFLKDADSQRSTSETARNWVKEVRKVSFMIEDAIDTFLLEVESLSEKERNVFKNSVKWMAKKPKKFVAMNKLDGAITKIQTKIKEINDNRASFGGNDQGASNNASNLGTVGSVDMSTVIPEDEKVDLIGFDGEKKEVEDYLLDQNILSRSVVFIAGIGGLGKTTLAKKVYESVRANFTFHIKLTVSKEFKPIDLLKKILEKAEIETNNEDYYVTKVTKYLTGKKYFIVLDDVHSGDVWARMKEALPDDGNGSRVLITTRNADIAQTADIKTVCALGMLRENEGIKLLFKKALPEEKFNEGSAYPLDLYEVAKTVFKKCGGLPLALVVVGGQLSIRPQSYDDWQSVMQTMNWLTDGKDCTKIFTSSYEDLPVYLRPCFMYFASFPEDHEYRAEFFTWLWISEGFIPQKPGTMEKIAKKYLDELARRCMIQVSKKSPDGAILTFRVHDLLREFAIREAEEKDFLRVLSKKDDFDDTNRTVRRLTFQLNDSTWDVNSSQENKFIQNINPNTAGKMVPFGSQFTLLRVLVIFHYNGTHLADPFPVLLSVTLKKLLQLRCLALIGCNFPWEVALPIDHLHNLITLEIRSCHNIAVLPKSLWGITTLRHVLVDRAYDLCDTLEGVSEPVNVPDLQTLGDVKINKPGIEFLHMLNLLKLHLVNEYDSWKPILSILLNLPKLESLTLESLEIPLEIIDTRKFPSYGCLYTLCLRGRWLLGNVELSAEMFPTYLTMLTVASSYLDQNSIHVLEKLRSLRILVLEMAYAEKTMICSRFPELQHLTLAMLKINKLEIEEGAMPKLKHLEISSCERLVVVPDLQRVKTLKVLSLRNMPGEFKRMMENEDKHKVEHIRSKIFHD